MKPLVANFNRRLRAVLAAACLLSGTADYRPTFAQERIRVVVPAANRRNAEVLAAPIAVNRQQVVDQIRRQLEPMLKVELSFVNRAANLNLEERHALIAASLKWFDEFVADFTKNQDPGEQQMWLQGMRGIRIGGDRPAADPRKSIEHGVAKVVSTTLSKEKIAAYERECAARTNFYREVAVANLVVIVDGKLNLSSKQRMKITDSLLADWQKGVVPELEVFFARPDEVPSSVEMWIRPELSESQRRRLSRIASLRSQEIFYGNVGWGPDNEVIEDIDLNVQLPVAAGESPN